MGTDPPVPRILPPEQRLADRLAAQQMPRPMSARAKAVRALGELGRVDLAVYPAIAGRCHPYAGPPYATRVRCGELAAAVARNRLRNGRCGWPHRRQAAAAGLVALAVDSAVVKIGLKLAARRWPSVRVHARLR